MERRAFLQSLCQATGALVFSFSLPRMARAADGQILVLPNEPIDRIRRHIYGHFIEHLGGVIYDGVWVGPDSKIPNKNGLRLALIDHMLRLPRAVMRWPGGCFADSYYWRDGIGPRQQRPTRTNFWINAIRDPNPSPARFDPNEFGTHEFIEFCRAINHDPYIAANVRSGTPRELYEWIEYCNSPAGSTTLAEERARNGSSEPFNVEYWGIGNEPWGCGGEFSPEDYADEFARFVAWLPRYGVPLKLIAAGPGAGFINDRVEWTHGFFRRIVEKRQLQQVYGWALHYYCWISRANAVEFDVADWYEQIHRGDYMDHLIQHHWFAMEEYDREHRVKLIVDEWGAWHAQSQHLPLSYLFSYPPTLRDAMVTARTLDIFQAHSDKVAMANVAQLVNTIHCLFLAHEDRFVATPNFHVFEMYGDHAEATAVRTVAAAPSITYQWRDQQRQLQSLIASASVKGKTLTVTFSNAHAGENLDMEVAAVGARLSEPRVTMLGGGRLQAHNTFENPNELTPRAASAQVRNGRIYLRVPPATIVKVTAQLG